MPRTRLDCFDFLRGYLMREKLVKGFRAGDMVRATVPVGAKPGIDPKAAPGTSASAGGAEAGGQASGQTAKPMSRYGGDVLIQGQSATAQTGGKASQPGQPGQDGQLAVPAHLAGTQALLQRLVAQQVGAQQGRGGDAGGPGGALAVPVAAQSQPGAAGGTGNPQGNVGALLTPTLTPKVTAAKIGDQNMLLAKGSQIDCAMTTKVVSEVSGFASCLHSENVSSDNGNVLLLERGSRAEGGYVAAIQRGLPPVCAVAEDVTRTKGTGQASTSRATWTFRPCMPCARTDNPQENSRWISPKPEASSRPSRWTRKPFCLLLTTGTCISPGSIRATTCLPR